jgi:hypothetical protein
MISDLHPIFGFRKKAQRLAKEGGEVGFQWFGLINP